MILMSQACFRVAVTNAQQEHLLQCQGNFNALDVVLANFSQRLVKHFAHRAALDVLTKLLVQAHVPHVRLLILAPQVQPFACLAMPASITTEPAVQHVVHARRASINLHPVPQAVWHANLALAAHAQRAAVQV